VNRGEVALDPAQVFHRRRCVGGRSRQVPIDQALRRPKGVHELGVLGSIAHANNSRQPV
jgi:hypothetical protein